MIIGHRKKWSLLKQLFKMGEIPHAFLFFGEKSIGKKKVALEFVKFVNCEAESFDKRPCQKCPSCKAIESNNFPDLIIVKPNIISSRGIGRKEIKISQIRSLIQRVSLKNYVSPFKIVIIDDAHYMNTEAQSAFLKILEEPKGNIIFFLITPFPDLLLPTILSRTEKMRFLPPSKEEINKFLDKKKIPEKKKEELEVFSSGKIGEIINYLSFPEKLERKKEDIEKIQEIPLVPLFKRFEIAKEIVRQKNVLEFLDTFSFYLRNIFLSKINPEIKHKFLKKEEYFLKKYNPQKLRRLINLTQRIYSLLSFTNINQKIALEMIFIEL